MGLSVSLNLITALPQHGYLKKGLFEILIYLQAHIHAEIELWLERVERTHIQICPTEI